mgnify:FL=1
MTLVQPAVSSAASPRPVRTVGGEEGAAFAAFASDAADEGPAGGAPVSGDGPGASNEPTAVGSSTAPDAATAVLVIPTAPGDDDEKLCGVCFEPPEAGKLVTLMCCRNILCLDHAQVIGVCPYCRAEPLVWNVS